MERSKAGTNKRSPDGLSHPNENTIIKKIMWKYFIRWKKYNEIQLTKNKMDLNNLKIKNHPPSPWAPSLKTSFHITLVIRTT